MEMQPVKRKRVSKKNKKSWRKNIDTTDVDKYLDNKRLEERIGGPFDKYDDQDIFELDAIPVSRKSNKKFLHKKNDAPLKCLQGLVNTSAVADPVIKRNRIRTKEERQHPILKKKTEQLLKKGLVKKKDHIQLKKILLQRLNRFNQKPKWRVEMNKDAWSDDYKNGPKIHKLENWFNNETLLHNIRNTKGIKEASNYRPEKNLKLISSFEMPHPGISYNPTFKDHTDLLNEVAEKELNAEKKELHLNRVTSRLFSRVTPAQKQRMWLKEMSEGLPLTNDVEEEDVPPKLEGESVNAEYTSINPPVTREKKKTRKQRNKELRLREEKVHRNQSETERKKIKDICGIKHIMAEIDEEKLEEAEKKLKRLHKRAMKVYEPGRVCKNKFDPGEEKFTLSGDLCGSLRELIPQGSIMKDKFVNMQKRNLIEVVKPQFKKRKAKSKRYTTASHRIDPVELPANVVLKNVRKYK